jgi:hypothetical protein
LRTENLRPLLGNPNSPGGGDRGEVGLRAGLLLCLLILTTSGPVVELGLFGPSRS